MSKEDGLSCLILIHTYQEYMPGEFIEEIKELIMV